MRACVYCICERRGARVRSRYVRARGTSALVPHPDQAQAVLVCRHAVPSCQRGAHPRSALADLVSDIPPMTLPLFFLI